MASDPLSDEDDSKYPPSIGLIPLPRGRHGLPREVVLNNQRERLLAGAAQAVAERGPSSVTVADVVRHAAVSRRTFYEHFANKEECFEVLSKRPRGNSNGYRAGGERSSSEDFVDISRPHDAREKLVRHYRRERVMVGVANAVAERGFLRVTLADIIRHAAVGRKTFYELFEDKNECIEAVYGASLASLREKEARQRLGAPLTGTRIRTPGSSDASEQAGVELIRLRPGRHGLSPEEVQRNQRERLLAGAALAIEERGYAGATVADITRHAKVSRATFYKHFSNKEECLKAACGVPFPPNSEEPS